MDTELQLQVWTALESRRDPARHPSRSLTLQVCQSHIMISITPSISPSAAASIHPSVRARASVRPCGRGRPATHVFLVGIAAILVTDLVMAQEAWNGRKNESCVGG